MIPAPGTLPLFQLFGEVAGRGLGLSLPGPALGMVALVLSLLVFPRLAAPVRPTAQGLFRYLGVLRDQGAALIAVFLLALVLKATGTPHANYFDGAQFVHFTLAPAPAPPPLALFV